MNNLILASGSPRRKEMLEWLELEFEIVPSDFDEDSVECDDPDELVEELSLQKALVVAKRNPDAIVLGADSVVSISDQILGKPKDSEDCKRMIRLLSGNTHQVFTGYALILESHNHRLITHEQSDIFFRTVSEHELDTYIEQADWQDKAGGYAIQEDPLKFITGYDGSYTNIMGLPILRVCEELKALGYSIPSNAREIVEHETGKREN